jgi:UDP-glucose:glycoprotein glucosyltransferase
MDLQLTRSKSLTSDYVMPDLTLALQYLKPTYPGQLHPVKRNAFNLIMVEDLSQTESLARIVNELQMMIKRLVPVRFGIVALLKEDDSICK